MVGALLGSLAVAWFIGALLLGAGQIRAALKASRSSGPRCCCPWHFPLADELTERPVGDVWHGVHRCYPTVEMIP